MSAFLHLLDDKTLGLTGDERNVLRTAGERRVTAEIWAEVTKRRGENAWPHKAAKQVPQ